MKIWIRYALGIAVGLGVGLTISDIGGDTAELWLRLSEIAIGFGRYLVVPLFFFGTIVSVHDMREHRQVSSTFGAAAAAIVALSAVAVLVGAVAVLFFQPSTLPVILEDSAVQDTPEFVGILSSIFPDNAFRVLVREGRVLLPAVVLAIALGSVIALEKRFASLLEDIFDGLCRVVYRLNAAVVQVFGVALVAVATALVVEFRGLGDLEFYGPMLLVIAVSAVVVALGFFPMLVYVFGRKWNPISWVYAMMAPAFVALVSGDVLLAGGTLVHTGKHNIGVKRQVGGSVLPISLMFARAGSAMVAAMAFIMVLRSYSGLEIGISQVSWIITTSYALSFLLPSVPGSGVIVLLAMLSGGYGQGLDDAYLILRPAAPFLVAIGAFVDIMAAGAVMHIVAGRQKQRDLPDVKDFV